MPDVSWDGQSCAADCAPPALKAVELRPADAPVGARVTGSGKSRPVTTGESATWTDTPKRMGVETLFARNGLDPDKCRFCEFVTKIFGR